MSLLAYVHLSMVMNGKPWHERHGVGLPYSRARIAAGKDGLSAACWAMLTAHLAQAMPMAVQGQVPDGQVAHWADERCPRAARPAHMPAPRMSGSTGRHSSPCLNVIPMRAGVA